jgi:hypothetical protein
MQLHIDPLEHGSQIARNLGIPEPHDSIALLLKPDLPLVISLGSLIIVVMSAIEFKDETFGRTEEIHDVRTDRCLTTEMCAVYWNFFQSPPQRTLMRCRVGAQSLGGCTTDRSRDHSISPVDRSPHPARCAGDPPPPGEGKKELARRSPLTCPSGRSRSSRRSGTTPAAAAAGDRPPAPPDDDDPGCGRRLPAAAWCGSPP